MQTELEKILEEKGLNRTIRVFEETTHTAVDAARSLGCQVDQIAKSIIFKDKSGEAVLVIVRGGSRVDVEKIEKLLGVKVEKAGADFVKEKSGFVIGGVPPFGHKSKIKTILDSGLRDYDEVWASAGSANSVFRCKAEFLREAAEGSFEEVV